MRGHFVNFFFKKILDGTLHLGNVYVNRFAFLTLTFLDKVGVRYHTGTFPLFWSRPNFSVSS